MMDYCCQIVAARDFDRPETFIVSGFPNFSFYSHSLRLNTFCIIHVFLIPDGDSDSLWYSDSPAYTAFGYQNVITVITGGRIAMKNDWFPYVHYTLGRTFFNPLSDQLLAHIGSRKMIRFSATIARFYSGVCLFPSSIARFCFFSKKARFSCVYSASVQTSRHFGSKDCVTAKHSWIRSQGYRLHAAQVGMPFSAQHFTTR